MFARLRRWLREARAWNGNRAVAVVTLFAVGVGVRLLLLLQWPDRLNADEATVGLMGLQILRGEFPVFFSGQGYMGGPEAYLTAIVYVLAGVSPLTLKLAVFLVSCLLIVVTFLVGKRMAGWPGGLTCALLAAIGPPFLPLFGNYPIGGYPEVVVVGSLILLLTLDLVTDERDGAPRERKLLLLAVLAGLGWWTNAMILSYIAAAGVFLLRPRLWSARALWLVPLAFLLGSLPFWIFNLTHAFWSFALFQGNARGEFWLRLEKTFSRLLQISGVWDPLTDPVPWLGPAAGAVYLVLLGVLLADLGRRPRSAPEARGWRRGVQLLLLFSLFHLTAFALNRFATLGGTQRYLFPLYSSLPVLTGIALLRLWGWSRLLAAGALGVLLLNNTLALGKTVQFFEAAIRRDWWKLEPVVDLLRSEGITRAYAGFWELGPCLTFEAQERVVVADPFEERYPPYRQWVDASPRIAYVLAGRYGVRAPRFESSLQAIGATYRRKDLGAFSIFYDFEPPDGGDLVSLRPDGWRGEAYPRGSDPARAFDRDVDTAWLSETSVEAGMWYRLDLGAVVPVGGVTILPARAWAASPKGYRIELSPDGTTWETVASVPEFDVTLRWRGGQPRMDRSGHIVSRFAPRPVRHVRVVQTGTDPGERWAIAEIFVYGPASRSGPGPEEASARVREGIRLESAEQWGPALAAYDRAVVRDPELEEAHSRMRQIFDRVGLPMEGSEPDRRAKLFEGLGMWRRAIREYERLVQQQAGDEDAHSEPLQRVLQLYRQHGDREAAERAERRLREVYSPPARLDVRFGRSARLLGFDVEPRQPSPGGVVQLSYYWQTLHPIAEDLAVFVHFVRSGKRRFGQDHEPLHGRYPTSRWQTGELLRERYRVRLPDELPAGEYEIRIGLWNPKTRSRLPVDARASANGKARLTSLWLRPPQ